MANQLIRLEIHTDGYPIIPEILNNKQKKSRRSSKSRSPANSLSIMPLKESSLPGSSAIPTRVFLYIQLREVLNLPPYKNLKLELNSELHMTKLQDHYTTDHLIDLTEEEIPTFSITITQDSFDHLNTLCDSPLRVTMYRMKTRKERTNDTEMEETIDEEEDGEVGLIPIAQGIIDLLQFFCKKRSFAEMNAYLYPTQKVLIPLDTGTTLTSFHVYTLLPLLKNLTLTNLCYIWFESIYNYPKELAEECEDLIAELSFQCKIKNLENVKVHFCKFSIFSECIISEQNTNLKWEKIKTIFNDESLAIQSGFKVRLNSLFHDLLWTEGVDFKFDDIDKCTDFALLCNSMHRFLLSRDMSRILEDVIAFDEQEIIVEIYRNSNPEEILLLGKIDLSAFVYPNVNSCGFAVELRSTRTETIARKTSTPSAKSSKQRSKSTLDTSSFVTDSSGQEKKGPTFCIINFCLLSPITEGIVDIQSFNENFLQSDKAKRCAAVVKEVYPRAREVICEETYREFDDFIETLIKYIIKQNMTEWSEGKAFLCCNLPNLVNKIMKIMACDFNVRFPTTTNLNFTNVMTTVYKELELRMYKQIQNWDDIDLAQCYVRNINDENKLITYMSTIKCLYEVGDLKMTQFLHEKLRQEFPNNVQFYFYTFLWDIEKSNFSSAREYSHRPIKEKVLNVEFVCDLSDIYMDYMDEDNEESETALENLLHRLELCSHNYARVIDGWIILHCFYKNCKYQAGVTYTRWKYENLYDFHHVEMPDIPKSRWELYHNYELEFQGKKANCFYQTMNLCLCVGLYKFAEVIYSNIANENTELDRYLMNTTLKLFLNEVDKKFVVKTFPTEKSPNAELLKAYNAQINGSVEYYQESFNAAMKSYGRILQMNITNDIQEFQLSFWRYGYHSMENEDYETAINAFEKCCTYMQGNKLVPYFQMGKSLYKLGRLSEAVQKFAESTQFHMHVSDAWGYLALINLKLGNNFNALECWKYAKLEPDNVISEEVLNELAKIRHSDVFLHVDIPL